MKNNRIIFKTLCAVLLTYSAGFAAAAGNQTLLVTADIKAICSFTATSTALPFGTIDPTSTVNATMSANVLYRCTKGTTPLIVTSDAALARNMSGVAGGTAAGSTLGYTLAFSAPLQPGKGFGASTDLTMVVSGTITPAQFQNATVGAYSESVTLNITP